MSVSASDPERAFEVAYEQHWQSVFRFAASLTNDLGEAEEIAQEAFVRLWEQRLRFAWQDPVLPWLLVVARRLATDRFRRLRRVASATTVRDLSLDDGSKARWLDVQAAFAALNPRERAAIVCIGVLGLSSTEVGTILEMSPNAVRSVVSRARSKPESECHE